MPELAIYLIEHAGELFEGLIEECLLPPPSPNTLTPRISAPIANLHQIEDEEDEEVARKLHQSTDSGLSGDGDISTASSTTNPPQFSKQLQIGQEHLSVKNVGRKSAHPPASVSPDSALFDNLLSDCSSHGDENQKYQRKIGKSTNEYSHFIQHPNAGIQIEEIEVNFFILCKKSFLKIRTLNAHNFLLLCPFKKRFFALCLT